MFKFKVLIIIFFASLLLLSSCVMFPVSSSSKNYSKYLQKGNRYLSKKEYVKALKAYGECASLARIGEVGLVEGICKENIGVTYFSMEKHSEAQKAYQDAYYIYKANGLKESLVSVLLRKSILSSYKGNNLLALEYLSEAYENASKPELKFLVNYNIAVIYRHLGNYQASLIYFNKLLENSEIHIDENILASVYSGLGNLYKNLNDFQKAEFYYNKASELSDHLNDRPAYARAVINKGILYRKKGNFVEALGFFDKAAEANEDVTIAHMINLLKGDVYNELGNMLKVDSLYNTVLSAESDNKPSNKMLQLNAKLRFAEINISRNNYSLAQGIVNKILSEDYIYYNQNVDLLERVYLAHSTIEFNLGKPEIAIDYLINLMNSVESTRHDIINLSYKEEYFSTKTEIYERAIEIAYMLYSLNYSLGKNIESTLAANTGWFFSESIKARSFLQYLEANNYSSKIRSVPYEFLANQSNIEYQYTSSFNHLGFLINTEQDMYGALVRPQSKNNASRELSRSLFRSNYPRYAANRYAALTDVENIPLRKGEYIIEYEITKDAIYSFVCSRRGIISFNKKSINRQDLHEKLNQFAKHFSKPDMTNGSSPFDYDLASELFDILLKENISVLPENAKIIIIPDETLFNLPFESLIIDSYKLNNDDKSKLFIEPNFVLDSYLISYYQSMQVLNLIRNREESQSSWSKLMLAIGDPVYNNNDPSYALYKYSYPDYNFYEGGDGIIKNSFDTDSIRLYRRLPYTREEVQTLGSIMSRNSKSIDILLGYEASEDSLRNYDLSDYRYIHFATHGSVKTDNYPVKEPALILSQINLRDNDGYLTMTEIHDEKITADLVTLSACDTGLGKELSGEGIVGLTRAFMSAGAQSVLVTLAKVEDYATSELIKKFYFNINQGHSKAVALQMAKTELRDKSSQIVSGYTISHEEPKYWAPFVLMGEY